MTCAIFFALVFALSAALTLQIRKSALHKQLLDIPNDRSLHTVPTPRGGGTAIVLVFTASIIALSATNYVETRNAVILIGCGSIVAIHSRSKSRHFWFQHNLWRTGQ